MPPQDDLLEVLSSSIKALKERDIVIITSKVISIWQGRCVRAEDAPNKDKLVEEEADKYLPRNNKTLAGGFVMHTIKDNIFIPSAGIDESNANGYYILWPKNSRVVAKNLWKWFREKYKVKDLGVIITDSHTIPLRWGVLGLSLAHYGFEPLKDYRGKPDLFGRKLKMTQTNIVDVISAAAVMFMGEGAECTPVAIVRDIPFAKFIHGEGATLKIKEKEDLYYPLLSAVNWRKGKGGYKITNNKQRQ